MLTKERAQEMYGKLNGLAGEVKIHNFDRKGVSGHYGELKMDITIPEVLVGLGIAVTEDEAQEFLAMAISAQAMGPMIGITSVPEMYHDLVKFGFHLGTLAGKVTGKGNTN